MIELFQIYKYAFILCFLAGLTLCLQGSHLVARRESLQILALAQGALVGNLVGRLLVFHSELATIGTSLIFFIALKIFFYFMHKRSVIGETFFIVAYLSLLAINYLLISIFPALEGHMAVGLFGDIVSLSETMTFVLIVVFSLLLTIYAFFSKMLFRRTFEKSVLGIDRLNFLEELLFLAVFICSLYGLGFLFSVATMIFPTVIIAGKGKNLKSILIIALIITGISSLAGLGASIVLERLSTVPTQVIIMLILLIIANLFFTNRRSENHD